MQEKQLRREIGVFGATMMGLGSIVGTGVFVSIGLGAQTTGVSVLLAIFLASLVAICNGLSSAQLAANHPVSGGTYEYGYRWLSPNLGFVAGWMFLCAKSASAATAALGFAGYLTTMLDLPVETWKIPLATGVLVVVTVVVLMGISRANWANIVIVTVTLISLLTLVVAGLPSTVRGFEANVLNAVRAEFSWARFLQATALMFVAYTGYGRIATLGEEVRDPRHTIPKAVIVTLLASMLLYLLVAVTAVGTLGAEEFGAATQQRMAPLEEVAAALSVPGVATLLSIGAMTAMAGVLLNLLLGLSRVLLAMGRRRDMPVGVAVISGQGVPVVATLVVAGIVAAFVLTGSVKTTWSFSAFTVLVYYALTNACAIRIAPAERLFPIWPAYVGLAACLFLAFWVEPIWSIGLGLIAIGLLLRLDVSRWTNDKAK
ncbi:MAG: APC family permease [Pirellulaceae bacterium]